MTQSEISIVVAAPSHLPPLMALYPLAFPEEDLTGLLRDLIEGRAPVLSLVATENEAVIGHVCFTQFDGADTQGRGALLGPLAVHPTKQGSGLGSRLVEEGFARLENNGIQQVLVLGDPAYYGRFGFRTEQQVLPPYELPEDWREAWQSVCLGGAPPLAPGRISLPGAWMRPELWQP